MDREEITAMLDAWLIDKFGSLENAGKVGMLGEVVSLSEPKAINLSKVKEVIEAKGLDKFVKSINEQDCTFSIDFPAAMVKGKSSAGRSREDYRPTDEQKKTLKTKGITLVDDEPGYVFSFQATNTKNTIDRGLQSLKDGALLSLAEQANDDPIPYLVASKSDCEDHTWKAINSYGTVVNAYSKGGGLFYDVWVPEIEGSKDILDAMFSGNIRKLSIGFSINQSDLQCNSCKRAIIDAECPHQPGQTDEKGNVVTTNILRTAANYEISAVAVPCQQQAHIQRNKSIERELDANVKSVFIPTISVKNSLIYPNKQNLESFTINLLDETSVNDFRQELGLAPLTLAEGGDNLMVETLENNDSDKIINSENTIEDNTQMSDKPETVTLNEEDKLCKVAEQVKTQAVAEIKSVLENLVEKQTETLKAHFEAQIKALDEKVSVLSAVKALEDKTDVDKALNELKSEVEKLTLQIKLDSSVPGSKSLVDMTNATVGAKHVSADADLLANLE